MPDIKEVAKNAASAGAAGGAGLTAVGVAGIPGLSAVGCTTGLATLGVGSMALGIGVVGMIGAGVFVGVKSLLDVMYD